MLTSLLPLLLLSLLFWCCQQLSSATLLQSHDEGESSPDWYTSEGCSREEGTPAQIALAWLLAQKPWIITIPGTSKLGHLKENIGAVALKLSSGDLREIDSAASKITIQGARPSLTHTPHSGYLFLGNMEILDKKMVFTAEKRGERCVCCWSIAARAIHVLHESTLPSHHFVCVLSTKVAHTPSTNFLRCYLFW